MHHKMYFNTGVKPENRLNKHDTLILGKFEVLKGGTIQIIYYLEKCPNKNYVLRYLIPESSLCFLGQQEIAIKIVDGGMVSDYAVFTQLPN